METGNEWQPDQVWRPYEAEYESEASIRRAVERINQRSYGELMADLRSRVEYFKPDARYENGIAYAVLDGPESGAYSKKEALVAFNPFANGRTDNMLIRSEFIRLCAEEADVRDEEGQLLPVVMVASPSISSELHLTQQEREAVAGGRFDTVAEKLLQPVKQREFGRIALAGHSQGADIAVSAAEVAYTNDLDAVSIATGDPAGITSRNWAKLGINFLQSSSSLKPNILAGEVEPAIIAQGLHAEGKPDENDMLIFARSALSRSNRSIWRGLSKDDFMGKVSHLFESGGLDKIVVAWGEDSSVTPAESLRREFSILEEYGKRSDTLTTIEVAGAQHGWGDNLPLLGRLYLEQFKA